MSDFRNLIKNLRLDKQQQSLGDPQQRLGHTDDQQPEDSPCDGCVYRGIDTYCASCEDYSRRVGYPEPPRRCATCKHGAPSLTIDGDPGILCTGAGYCSGMVLDRGWYCGDWAPCA